MPPSHDKVHDITAEKIHETAKALKFDDGTQEFWIPKSLTWVDGIIQLEQNADGSYTITAPEWWLRKNGLI